MTRLDPTPENGFTKVSVADAFQVRSASVDRFLDKLGVLPEERMERIELAVQVCIQP